MLIRFTNNVNSVPVRIKKNSGYCLHSCTPELLEQHKFKFHVSCFMFQDSRFKVQSSRFKIQDSTSQRINASNTIVYTPVTPELLHFLNILNLKFKVQNSRFKVQYSTFQVSTLRVSGFNVKGFRFQVSRFKVQSS